MLPPIATSKAPLTWAQRDEALLIAPTAQNRTTVDHTQCRHPCHGIQREAANFLTNKLLPAACSHRNATVFTTTASLTTRDDQVLTASADPGRKLINHKP